jgi:anthranilate 1,2-dioxygenase small subunit
VKTDHQLEVQALIANASASLDNEAYQDWLDLFHDECVYRIVPQENIQQGLPASVMLCETKKALSDRIVSLLKANTYNPHTSRHLTGPPRIVASDGDRIEAETNYALYQTNVDGASHLFAVGCYRDRIGWFDNQLKFVERLVVLDTFSIPTLLAKPV